jgi:hypothetical protein
MLVYSKFMSRDARRSHVSPSGATPAPALLGLALLPLRLLRASA